MIPYLKLAELPTAHNCGSSSTTPMSAEMYPSTIPSMDLDLDVLGHSSDTDISCIIVAVTYVYVQLGSSLSTKFIITEG